MKFVIAVLFPAVLLFCSCSSPGISSARVPSVVLNTLKAKYPVADNADWEKHSNLYEAELDINDSVEVSVQIDETGRLIMQKQEVPHTILPPGILTFMKDQYKDFIIDDAEKIEKNGIVYYQVELKGKGKKEINLVFSADGKEEKSIPYWD